MKRLIDSRPLKWMGYGLCTLVLLTIPLLVLTAMKNGEAGYRNYWGGFVESWTALGLFVLITAVSVSLIVKRRKREKTPPKPKSRKERLAAKKAAKKAKKGYEPPLDHWRKW